MCLGGDGQKDVDECEESERVGKEGDETTGGDFGGYIEGSSWQLHCFVYRVFWSFLLSAYFVFKTPPSKQDGSGLAVLLHIMRCWRPHGRVGLVNLSIPHSVAPGKYRSSSAIRSNCGFPSAMWALAVQNPSRRD